MSYSNSFPTQRPTLNLDFANSGKLDSRISYTRSSTGTAFSAERHLSSENLIDKSNAYDSGGWSESRVDQTSGQSDPSGGTSAKLIDQTSGQTTAGVVYYTGTFGANELTFSIFLKPNGRTKPNLAENLTDSGNTVKRTYFDLTGSGAVGTKDAAHTASIAKFGDWYRCTITFTPHAADSGSVYLYISDTDNSQTVADDGNGYTVFGANLSTTGQLVTSETSGSIHREFAPTLKTAAADEPRFEFSATDGQSEGLLIEAQATNLARYSSDISSWNSTSTVNLTSNAGIAPNGQLEADLIVFPSTATQHYVYDNTISLTSGTTYTTSVYVKSAGQRYFQLCGNSGGFGFKAANFDLESATSINVGGATSTITAIGNGWYRLAVTMTADTTFASGGVILINVSSLSAGHFPATAGNDYDGVLCWGFQTEVGSSASSIISTSGAAATRSTDSCSVATSSFYTGGPVSVYTEVTAAAAADGTQRMFTLFENSDLVSAYFSGGGDIKTFVDVGGNTQVDASILASAVSGTDYKVAISFDTNDYRGVSNGTLGAADTSCTLPTFSSPTLQIAAQSGGTNPLSGHIKRLSLFNVALSDVELQSLTTI